MTRVEHLSGLEILDSRGQPTIKARCRLRSGATGVASVPSGASTGAAEAWELRDGDPARYRGKGCRTAAAHLAGAVFEHVRGRDFATQADFDQALIALDGTPNKSRLGGNTLLAASLAFARACAIEAGQTLYAYFSALRSQPVPEWLPRPMINLFSGGKHAGGQVKIQDVLVMPVATESLDELLAITGEIYRSAAEIIQGRYHMRLLRADEGGQAPPFEHVEAMFETALEAIRRAGLQPGSEVALAVDVASSHFYHHGRYHLDQRILTSDQMIALLRAWSESCAIVSIEDGLAEEDWDGWPALRRALGERCLTLGDDLLCTNPGRIERAVGLRAASALLLKVNQIGTLTEAAQACGLAQAAGWRVVVSARSGETEDDWLADLAFGWGGDHIKVGSVTQSERLAKYNRLLEIAAQTGYGLARWPTR